MMHITQTLFSGASYPNTIPIIFSSGEHKPLILLILLLLFLNVLSKCADRIIFRATFFSELVKLYSYLPLQSRGGGDQEWSRSETH